MKKVIFAAMLCMAIFTACSDNNSSEYPEKVPSQTTTTTVTTLTTTAMTTSTVTTTTVTTKKSVSQPIRDLSETEPPFGDLHDAYVCIGGIDIYPSVYVLTHDEVSKLADYFNSEIWTEESMDDYIPPTGSMGMTYYIYKDGEYSSFGDLTSVYYSDGVRRNFKATPSDGDYAHRLSARDFLYKSDGSRNVRTHINEQNVKLTDQEFWDLIWNDVLPWIEENGY
jgi:hypothetical protein